MVAKKESIHCALLRGINVGGNNIVSMAKLKTSFEKMGFVNVRTYINSGNVIFQTDEKSTEKLEKKIEASLHKTFKLPIKVVVRSQKEMERVFKNIPKDWTDSKLKRYNVIFLRRSVDSKKILANFNPKPEIEEVIYKPGVLYWSALISGLTRSNMLKLASMPIYKEMTIRNLNTTRKVYEIMKETKLPSPKRERGRGWGSQTSKTSYRTSPCPSPCSERERFIQLGYK